MLSNGPDERQGAPIDRPRAVHYPGSPATRPTRPMPHDLTTSVLRNIDLGRGHHLIELAAPPELASTGPAQFFMVGVPGTDTLLRRPYSVCGLPGTFADGAAGAVQILLRVVGRGTRLLASLAAGAPLHVLGPLGRGFEPPAPGVRPVLVAGGIGAAPFPAFVASLAGRDVRPVKPKKPPVVSARCRARDRRTSSDRWPR